MRDLGIGVAARLHVALEFAVGPADETAVATVRGRAVHALARVLVQEGEEGAVGAESALLLGLARLYPGQKLRTLLTFAAPLGVIMLPWMARNALLTGNPLIKGLTTNPTLMKKAGITNYEAFAKDILQTVKDKPISFEVFSDEFAEMRRQAMKIAARP